MNALKFNLLQNILINLNKKQYNNINMSSGGLMRLVAYGGQDIMPNIDNSHNYSHNTYIKNKISDWTYGGGTGSND